MEELRHEKLAGTIFQVLIDGEDSTRLMIWGQMINLEIIRQRGLDDGKRAGSWVIDGNTDEDTIRKLVKGIEEVDPEVMDSLPMPRLGGEMAGDPTWDDILVDELGWPRGIAKDPQLLDDGLYESYDQAFSEGLETEIMRAAKVYLGEVEFYEIISGARS